MSYQKQKRKITLKIVPHTDGEIRSLRLSKGFIKFLFLSVLLCAFTLVGSLYYYYNQYNLAEGEINNLLAYKDRNNKLKNKNKFLEKKVSQITSEIEQIKAEFGDIITENQEIKKMINFNGKMSSNDELDIDETNSIGYYDFENSKNPNLEKVQYTEANLNMLKEALPQKKHDLYKLKKQVEEYNRYLAAKPKGWPIRNGKGRITSPFGVRYHPVLKEKRFHDGIDIAIWYNHKIIATGKGKVIFSGTKGGYGRTVVIDHGYGYRTLYAHNNRLLVRVGQWVNRGDVIALSGNSGRSTGPHTHYEIRYKGKAVDPMKYQ
ncbi:M23 family metallopeptidase [Orenia marismortui]|uniref:M23 family metallopeptidase n=1 Tax=Orenia marismortui TaxID=46469 RepID=UPI000371A7A5|nr:M23 family metallopeptidase [Orenia marismortui]